jgi:hypothetical protein
MFAECSDYPSEEFGCANHGQADCLCDVKPLARGVPIRAIPFAERLLELGVSRFSFLAWAEELHAWEESQDLRLVAEA